MKRLVAILLICASLLAIVSCAATDKEPAATTAGSTEAKTTAATTAGKDPTGSGPLDKSRSYRILFIGNSYTHYNSMPTALFAKIAKAAGYDVTVETVMKGSYTLEAFADPSDAYGKQVHAKLKSDTKYDFVIIQEQSSRPVSDTALFYDGARALDQLIRANGAQTVLYSTWGHKTGHSLLSTMNWTNESMTWELAAKYAAIGEELDATVAHVGLAFYDVFAVEKSLEVYNEDKKHPSFAGSYLAALTLFSKIFGVTPVGNSFRSTLTEADAAILQQAAHDAVFNTPEIPEKYKTSSEGVFSPTKGQLEINDSQRVNLTAYPQSSIISVPKSGSLGGILGTKGKGASTAYSTSGFTAEQKADIADIGYGVSYIGVEKINTSKGEQTAFANLVNGEWSSSKVTNLTFDQDRYDVNGKVDNKNGKYTALITLNFGKMCEFDAIGFFSGSLEGFPGAAEVFISEDGVTWTRVATACWDAVNGAALKNAGQSPADPNGATQKVGCLFDMGQGRGQYVRIGIVTGRYDSPAYYNTINTRELVVYGKILAQ